MVQKNLWVCSNNTAVSYVDVSYSVSALPTRKIIIISIFNVEACKPLQGDTRPQCAKITIDGGYITLYYLLQFFSIVYTHFLKECLIFSELYKQI